jgi:hypothetical protein
MILGHKASEIPELAVIKDLHHRLRFAFLYLVLLMIGVGVPCARLDHLAPDCSLFCSALRTIDELGLDRSIVSGMLLFSDWYQASIISASATLLLYLECFL